MAKDAGPSKTTVDSKRGECVRWATSWAEESLPLEWTRINPKRANESQRGGRLVDVLRAEDEARRRMQ